MGASRSNKGLSLWPKLLLWAVVVVGGIAYLLSVNHKVSESELDEGPAQTGEMAPMVLPGAGHLAPAAALSESGALVGSAALPPEASPVPVAPLSAVEPVAVGAADEQTNPADQWPVALPPQTPADGGARALDAEVVDTALPQADTIATHASDDKGAESTEGETRQSPVVSTVPDRFPTVPQSAVPVSPSQGAPAAAQDPVAQSMEQRPARSMAEYQAIQRRYQEQIRQHWERMGRPRTYRGLPYGGYRGHVPWYYPPAR